MIEQTGERAEQLRPAPDARRPDHGAGWERRSAGGSGRRRVGALGDGGDHEAVLVLGGQVLRRVHRQVDLAALERVEDRVDEQTLQPGGASADGAPSSPEVVIGTSSASTPDPCEAPPDLLGLRERERGATGADAEASLGSRLDAEELGEQRRVRVLGAGRGALLQLDDRIVQQLRRDAASERLDGLALVGGE